LAWQRFIGEEFPTEERAAARAIEIAKKTLDAHR
jgi:hypothetical protein